jgi:hypothetical protein
MKQKISILILVMAAIIILSPTVHASLVNTLSISGLPDPSGVEAFNVWYDVDTDFVLISSTVGGTAIPTAINLGWAEDGASVAGDLFKFSGSNMDGWALSIENNMLNGAFASFEYEGTILGVNFFQFGDIGGNEIGTISLDGLTATSTDFSNVPIPSTILLLGGGLVALVGLRRRRS